MAALVLLGLGALRRRRKRRQLAQSAPHSPGSPHSGPSPKRSKKNAKEDDICRICLKEGSIPIFKKSSKGTTVDNIRIFGNVELSEEDDYPKMLCEACNSLLRSATLFRKLAQDSDRILRKKSSAKIPHQSETQDLDMENDMDNIDTGCDEIAEKEETVTTFNCKICEIEFPNAKELSEHRKSESHIKARVRCEVCQVVCANRYLKIHMMRFHSIVQPFICDVCGKSFPVKGSFDRHCMIHTDELPFKCSECPYRGRFRESLKMHTRIHTGEKPYACEQCPARFLNASNLKKHSRTHQSHFDFKCDQCDRGFYTLQKLTEHLWIDHTGLKEHKCPDCGKEFGYRKQMMKHSRKVHHRAKLQSGRLPLYLQIDKKMQEKQRNYEQQVSN